MTDTRMATNISSTRGGRKTSDTGVTDYIELNKRTSLLSRNMDKKEANMGGTFFKRQYSAMAAQQKMF